jgi:hypothetical protein
MKLLFKFNLKFLKNMDIWLKKARLEIWSIDNENGESEIGVWVVGTAWLVLKHNQTLNQHNSTLKLAQNCIHIFQFVKNWQCEFIQRQKKTGLHLFGLN